MAYDARLMNPVAVLRRADPVDVFGTRAVHHTLYFILDLADGGGDFFRLAKSKNLAFFKLGRFQNFLKKSVKNL